MRTILVRHGQTDWNRDKVFRGRADIPLNSTGRQEAAEIRRALSGLKLDSVYSSPLSRAFETAQIAAAGHGLEPEIDTGFLDIDYGEWQGLPLTVVKERYKELYQRWCDEPHLVTIPGGESLEDVSRRSLRALEEIRLKHQGETVLIVSHRVVNKVLLCAVLGLDSSNFWRIKQDNCAINIFDCLEDGFVIHTINDTCHLGPIGERFDSLDF